MVGGIIAKKEVYLTMLARLKNVTKVGGRMNEQLKPCPFCGHSIDIEKMCMSRVGIGTRHLLTQIVVATLLTSIANVAWSFVLVHMTGVNL